MNSCQLTAIPRDFLVEVTNRCNHKCMFCAHHKMICRQGEIDPFLLKRILQEAYGMNVRRVGLYTTGEIFMCKEIASHICNAKDIGYEYIYVDTNGALANEENLRNIIDAGVDSIKFSINAGTRESYKQIHGYDDFDVVIHNLKICHMLKKAINPNLKIMVSFVVTKMTENEHELLQSIVSPYIDEFVTHPVRAYFLQMDEDISYMTPSSMPSVVPNIPCPMVFNRIHLTFDGFLTACCNDFNHDLLLADLNTMSLQDAWVSENAIKLREAHINRQLDGIMCSSCVHERFVSYNPLMV